MICSKSCHPIATVLAMTTSIEQSGQAHVNSPNPSIMRGLNTLRAEHGCNATSSIRASAHPCGAFCFMGNSAEFPMK